MGDLKSKSKVQLQEELLQQRWRLQKLKFQAAARSLKNVKEIKQTRKTIARILTLLNQLQSHTPKRQPD